MEVLKELGGVKWVALTTDCWTNSHMQSFITLTVHFIDNNWELKAYNLDTWPFNERHTAENLLQYLTEQADKWNIDRYPILSELAKQYLCCPASSVSSERVFSKTGTIDTDKRNRLRGELVGMLVFLNTNAPLLE